MAKELILKIGYDATKIFNDEKDYLKSCGGLARFTDTGLIYLDEVVKQIQAKSEKSKIKGIKKDVTVEGNNVITKLIVKYKNEVPTIPEELKEKLKVSSIS